MERYKIVRSYFKTYRHRTIRRGLTLEEARRHCQDPETSSTTAKLPHNTARTRRLGPWFDGYDEDNGRGR
jgi:hypothetical protein